MPINWQDLLTNVGSTLVSGVVVVGAAAWLIRTLVSDRLARDVEAFKIRLKADADAEIERVRADLMRASRVHERQLDILGRLYRHLCDAQALFQGMTRTGRMAGELTPERYAPLVRAALEAARDEFLNGRLLIPPGIVDQCGEFLDAMFEGQMTAELANDQAFRPDQRSHLWNSAATVAHEQLPRILRQIDEAARAAIHG